MKFKPKNLIIYILIFAVALWVSFVYRNALLKSPTVSEEIPLSDMINKLNNEEFVSVNINGTTITGMVDESTQYYSYTPTTMEAYQIYSDYILPQVEEGNLELTAPKPEGGSFWLSILPNILMIGAMIFLLIILLNNGGQGKAFQFGKSKARMAGPNDKKITFKDVAGLEEEKRELEEVVDFLRNPAKYKSLGARIPKGMLLVGPPGTGKTYISRAAAGEAGVPFFTISGSDFVEMFVGVGASRVRDLFDQAKKNAPCIVFIDEIDAVGRKRGAGIGGGHDEREQTLNQLLVEMDGFEENSGIIVMAATNRPDILDPALLRPGRFDRRIVIGLPDVKGREEIFKVHSKNKPLAPDVTPEVLAKQTVGFTPADIENLLNEAALLTARRNGRLIRMEEIEEAVNKVLVGPEKKSRIISEKEKKLTAYHEAGHAIVARSLPDFDPVHFITIIPRGMAGGFTQTLPKEDASYGTKTGMFNEIVDLLGGRVAEALTLDDISTGASNDIQRATEIARDMVTKYGFSEKVGTISYGSSEEVFLGNDFTTHKNYSDETAEMIDNEIRRIVDEAYKEANRILTENKDALVRVAEALLLIENLDGDQFEALYSGAKTPEEVKADVDEAAKKKAERDADEAKETEKIIQEIKASEEAARKAELDKMAQQSSPNGGFVPYGMTPAEPSESEKHLPKKLSKEAKSDPDEANFEKPEETSETDNSNETNSDKINTDNENTSKQDSAVNDDSSEGEHK